MERISDRKLEIDVGETPAREGMNRPRGRLSRSSEPGEPETAATLPPAGARVKAVGGGREGRARQPAQGSFLTAIKGRRRVLPRGIAVFPPLGRTALHLPRLRN
jgi:hypothetical protein